MTLTPPSSNNSDLTGWSVTGGSPVADLSSIDIGYDATTNYKLDGKSGYGALLSWGPAAPEASECLKSTINFAAIKNYSIFAASKPIYFNFDQFFYQEVPRLELFLSRALATSSNTRTVLNATISSNIATLTISGNPGYAVGEEITVPDVDNVIRSGISKAWTTTVVTLTLPTGHAILSGDSITVNLSDVNVDGTYTVATAGTTTVTYSKSNAGTQSTVAATGTITHNLFNGGPYTITAVSSGATNSVSFTKNRTTNYTVAPSVTISSISIANPAVITTSAVHGLYVGRPVYFTTTGVLPSAILPDKRYYVLTVPTTTTFTVSDTPGGTAISTVGGTQAGTHTINKGLGGSISLYGKTISGTRVAVQTATSHGLEVGDWVYLNGDLDASDGTDLAENGRAVYSRTTPFLRVYYGGSFQVTDVIGSDWFCYKHSNNLVTYDTGAAIVASPDSYFQWATEVDRSGSGTYTYTLRFTEPHPFQVGDSVTVDGTNVATGAATGWSGTRTVTAVSGYSISFSSTSSDYSGGVEYRALISWAGWESNFKIFRTAYPAYDLSNVKIQYGENELAVSGLEDVLSISELAIDTEFIYPDGLGLSYWDRKRIRFTKPDDVIMSQLNAYYVYYGGYQPKMSAYRDEDVVLDSKKIYDKYLELNPTGLQSEENLYLLIPTRVDCMAEDGITYVDDAPLALSTSSLGQVIDNVKFSTAAEFFYGDSGSGTYRWFTSESEPDSASIRSTKKWIDVDLDAGTSAYEVNSLYITDNTYASPAFNKGFIGPDTIEYLRPTELLVPEQFSNSEYSSTAISSAQIFQRSSSGPEISSFLRTSLNLAASENSALFDLRARASTSTPTDYSLGAAVGITARLQNGYGGVISFYSDSILLLGPDGLAPSEPPMSLAYKVDDLAFVPDGVTGSIMDLSPNVLSRDSHVITHYTNTDVSTANISYQLQTSGIGAARKLTATSCYVIAKTGPAGGVNYSFSALLEVTNTSYRTSLSLFVYEFTTVDSNGFPIIGDTFLFKDPIDLVSSTTAANTWSKSGTFYTGSPNTQYVFALGLKTSNALSTATAYSRQITITPLY